MTHLAVLVLVANLASTNEKVTNSYYGVWVMTPCGSMEAADFFSRTRSPTDANRFKWVYLRSCMFTHAF